VNDARPTGRNREGRDKNEEKLEKKTDKRKKPGKRC
jgi:hypothetical protein